MKTYEMDWSEFEERGRARRRRRRPRRRFDLVTIAGSLLAGWLVIAITWGIV